MHRSIIVPVKGLPRGDARVYLYYTGDCKA
jgi:hypothetical protein